APSAPHAIAVPTPSNSAQPLLPANALSTTVVTAAVPAPTMAPPTTAPTTPATAALAPRPAARPATAPMTIGPSTIATTRTIAMMITHLSTDCQRGLAWS